MVFSICANVITAKDGHTTRVCSVRNINPQCCDTDSPSDLLRQMQSLDFRPDTNKGLHFRALEKIVQNDMKSEQVREKCFTLFICKQVRTLLTEYFNAKKQGSTTDGRKRLIFTIIKKKNLYLRN